MMVETFLRRLVVIRNHRKHSIDTCPIASLEFLDDGHSIVAAATEYYWHSASDHFCYDHSYFLSFFKCERWCFCSSTKHSEEIGSRSYLKLYKTFECLVIYRKIRLKWCYQGYAHSFYFLHKIP